MRTILIEDEHHILGMMERIVKEEPSLEWVGSFQSPTQALTFIQEHPVDLVFLDIEMPEMTGLELATYLPERTQVVFTTAHQQYAVEAFNLHATHYLLKPITEQMIHSVIPRIVQRYEAIQQKNPHQSCRIQFLDRFSVRTQDGNLVKWPTQKTEELFAYLVYHRKQVINKWVLAETLYPDIDEPQRALHNVYNAIYRLKKTLAEHELDITVKTINNGYSIELGESCACDYYEWLDSAQPSIPKTELQNRLFVDKDYTWH
ncbi:MULTISPECIES: response regulator [unclassified Exiguobacterium]|uniref:response regulator n=1 Tax=unclassified Exiguobacterium TaxID=2644629 RepID=UPI001BEC2441|nr:MULTISPECIES: response regulator [unclassified Exiguobacterium]